MSGREKELTELACDIASTRNVSPQEALNVLVQAVGFFDMQAELTTLRTENKALNRLRDALNSWMNEEITTSDLEDVCTREYELLIEAVNND